MKLTLILFSLAMICAAFWPAETPMPITETPSSSAKPSEGSALIKRNNDELFNRFQDTVNKGIDSEHSTGEISMESVFRSVDEIGLSKVPVNELLLFVERLKCRDESGGQYCGILFIKLAELFGKGATEGDVTDLFKMAYKSRGDARANLLALSEGLLKERDKFAGVTLSLFENVQDDGTPEQSVAESLGHLAGRIGGVKIAAQIFIQLGSEDPVKKLAAQYSLPHLRNDNILAVVLGVVENGDKYSREQQLAAMDVLGSIPSEFSAINLAHFTRDVDLDFSSAAENALNKLISKNESLKPIAEKAKAGEL